MKHSKILILASLAAVATMAFAANASATTLEVNGITKGGAVEITASLESKSSMLWQSTSGGFDNTCTSSHFNGTTNVFTGTRVSGPVNAWSFTNCSYEPVVVDKAGNFSVEHITGSTNGTVRSDSAEVTVPVAAGFTVNCKTGSGVDIGTLTGVGAGAATLHIKAVLNCGFLTPSVLWTGAYTVTTDNLGVSA